MFLPALYAYLVKREIDLNARKCGTSVLCRKTNSIEGRLFLG